MATVLTPYIKGTSERVRRCLSQTDISVAFGSRMTIRSLSMRVKTRKLLNEQKGVIYEIPSQDRKQVYIAETGGPLDVGLKEHQRQCKNGEIDKSAVTLH